MSGSLPASRNIAILPLVLPMYVLAFFLHLALDHSLDKSFSPNATSNNAVLPGSSLLVMHVPSWSGSIP